MIGHVITTWENVDEFLVPALPVGHGVWTDVTGEATPAPPGMIVVQVEAPQEWFDALPEGSVIWVE